MNTPQRPLQDYLAEVSERAEVRRGVPLPSGTHETGE
jgi:isoamylase